MTTHMTWLANSDFDTAWAHHAWSAHRDLADKAQHLAILPVFGIADHGLGHPLDAEEIVGAEILHRAVLHAKSVLGLRVLPPLRFALAPYPHTFFGIDPETAHDLVRDIDAIVKQVSYTGWNETQAGDRTVRKEVRVILKKYRLPLTGPLFDNTYAYIRENY